MTNQTANRAPRVYRVTAVFIFLFGVAIHSLRLLVGSNELSEKYFIPPVDGAFGILLLISAIAGWLSFRYLTGGRLSRVIFFFGLALITISVPIHLRGFIIGSTQYIANFPPLYSIVEIPMFLGLSYAVTRLKFR